MVEIAALPICHFMVKKRPVDLEPSTLLPFKITLDQFEIWKSGRAATTVPQIKTILKFHNW